jgi:diguanylate cyclase (GGDEF)-like protein
MLDIDNFKTVNDTYGHQFGDRVLETVSKIIKSSIRETDIPSRYGGDEFTIILPHTDIKGAKVVSERIFNKINSLDLSIISQSLKTIKHKLTVSISAGEFEKRYTNREKFIEEIDKKLYEAKSKGKNRIEYLS